ncbi:protein YhjJ [Klebsiella michiganensis]|uniref:Protein YhjJ n=1 Tax=Klebsiella michiganensis TaxID=1134687 RepID=A0A7H4PFW1_9ENTR|nr:protein YhjJ [Klebsiella michiganensis]
MTDAVRQDKLSLMWDAPWQPIRDSVALQRYWRDDLAREALFWHVQQNLKQKVISRISALALTAACSTSAPSARSISNRRASA